MIRHLSTSHSTLPAGIPLVLHPFRVCGPAESPTHSREAIKLCTHAGDRGTGVKDVGVAEQGDSVSGDTAAATTDVTTVLSPTAGPSDSDTGAVETDSGAATAPEIEEPLPAPAPAPAPVLPPVPVNPNLGSYDPPMPMPVIPVAAAVLPSGKVRCRLAVEVRIQCSHLINIYTV